MKHWVPIDRHIDKLPGNYNSVNWNGRKYHCVCGEQRNATINMQSIPITENGNRFNYNPINKDNDNIEIDHRNIIPFNLLYAFNPWAFVVIKFFLLELFCHALWNSHCDGSPIQMWKNQKNCLLCWCNSIPRCIRKALICIIPIINIKLHFQIWFIISEFE